MTDAELMQLKELGEFHSIRELPDGTVAGVHPVGPAAWSLVLGVTGWGWRYRFRFDSLEAALAAFAAVQAESDIPENWLQAWS